MTRPRALSMLCRGTCTAALTTAGLLAARAVPGLEHRAGVTHCATQPAPAPEVLASLRPLHLPHCHHHQPPVTRAKTGTSPSAVKERTSHPWTSRPLPRRRVSDAVSCHTSCPRGASQSAPTAVLSPRRRPALAQPALAASPPGTLLSAGKPQTPRRRPAQQQDERQPRGGTSPEPLRPPARAPQPRRMR